MERQFMIQEITALREDSAYKKYGITESELRRRFIQAVKYFSDGIDGELAYTDENFMLSDWWWTTYVLPVLLHGEPKQKDEWLDFAESLDDGLHHWSAGNGIGYLVETFRKMPRGK